MSAALLRLASDICAEHAAVGDAAQSALHHARRAGELLTEAKEALAHGAWLPWLAEHCPTVPARTAQLYMRIASEWPRLAAEANTQRVAHLTVRDAVALLAEPREGPAPAEAAIDLPALQQDLADDEEAASETRRELDTLALALQSPSLTIEQAGWIVRRTETIEADWFERRTRALCRLGELLNAAPATNG